MNEKTEDLPDVTSTEPAPPSRADKTRHRIFNAVISCLDELGYSETSINRVQTAAGVSRGALTHHFPSKEEMMVKTLEHVLAPVRGTSDPDGDATLLKPKNDRDDLREELQVLWQRVINTREGRALMEILVASRTDDDLRTRITPSLWAYNNDFNRNIAHIYRATSGDNAELALLWSICRSFMRGLHTQSPYEEDPESITKMVDLFGRIMAPHLQARPSGAHDENAL